MANNPNPGLVGGGCIISEFAEDPDMLELIGLFVEEMPQRISQLQTCWERRQLLDLKRAAHQLKGASGGYGFPTLGQAAGEMEASLAAAQQAATPDLDSIQKQFNDLISLCRRVST